MKRLTFTQLMGAGMMCLMASCTTTRSIPLEGSAEVPAARGKILLVKTDDLNRKLTVEVEHLAEPNRVSPSANAYVVWIAPVSGDPRPQNAGAIMVDQSLHGKLETNVAYDEFSVFVTAEPSKNVTNPSGKKILTQRVEIAR